MYFVREEAGHFHLSLSRSAKSFGASAKTCYEHYIPGHALCRGTNTCTAGYFERATYTVM